MELYEKYAAIANYKSDINIDQIISAVSIIMNMEDKESSQKYFDQIFLLIVCHYTKENSKPLTGNVRSIYGLSQISGGKGIKVNMNKLPHNLLAIIQVYIESHID